VQRVSALQEEGCAHMRHRAIRHPKIVAGTVVAAALAVAAPIVAAQMSGDPFVRHDVPGPCFGCKTTPAENPLLMIKKSGVTGYADPWEVQPGQTVSFHVSSDAGNYTSDIVRVFHLDPNPKGPGIHVQVMPSPSNGVHPGKNYDQPVGSYVDVRSSRALQVARSFTITAWIAPTTIPGTDYNQLATPWSPALAPRPQGIVSKRSGNSGYGLVLDQNGALALRLGNGSRTAEVSTGTKLRPWVPALPGGVSYIPPGHHGAGTPGFGQLTGTNSTWYFVAASYNASTGRVTLLQDPQNAIVDPTRVTVQSTTGVGRVAANTAPLLMGAGSLNLNPTGPVNESYNGKIDNPRIYDRALGPAQLHQIEQGGGPAPSVAWDFMQGIRSNVIYDTSNSAALTGHTVNLPTRAVTGHNWQGSLNYLTDPGQFGGIYFHQDDMANEKWPTAFQYKVPANAESGVYAVRLQAGGHTYYASFFVRPKNYTPTSSIALVIPTFSYLAYAETGTQPNDQTAGSTQDVSALCLYCYHADGSSFQYSSRLRPITSQQPQIGVSPWQFVADTHITDWLHAKGIKVDILTDQDVNNQGANLLDRYQVVMTGSHPEYISGREFHAFQQYTHHGGRVMYMGGNGFYWVTGVDPTGTFIEVRKRDGTEAYQIPPGESMMTTTAEEGGLWRFRGMAPQAVVDTGFTAQGFDRVRPYKRMPDSFNPEAAFIFQGVGNEMIGDFPSLQLSGNLAFGVPSAVGNGAAGEELDRVDNALGSPSNTLVLARATGFSDAYQLVVEEVQSADSLEGGTVNPLVYADMAYNKFIGGGAVFAASSISYAGSLYFNNYNNNVSTITGNVLRQFDTPGPLP
jgi:N,N-dimethylformamidase